MAWGGVMRRGNMARRRPSTTDGSGGATWGARSDDGGATRDAKAWLRRSPTVQAPPIANPPFRPAAFLHRSVFDIRRLPSGEKHCCAFRGQPLRDRSSDPFRAANNQRDFVRHVSHHHVLGSVMSLQRPSAASGKGCGPLPRSAREGGIIPPPRLPARSPRPPRRGSSSAACGRSRSQ